MMGGYEPNPEPWARRSALPEDFDFHAARAGLGSFRADHGAGARPRAGARERGRQADHQRARELHARRQLHPRRGAGSARTSSSAPASTPSASPRAAGRAWRSPNGWREASRPSISGPSISAASAATISTSTGCAHAHAGGLCQALHDGLAARRSIASGRPLRRSPLYDRLKAAGRGVRREAGLGTRQLVCRPAGESARRPLHLRTAELVRGGRRASIAPAASASALFDQTSFAKFLTDRAATPRRRCRGSRANDVAQAAGLPDLHADAESHAAASSAT